MTDQSGSQFAHGKQNHTGELRVEEPARHIRRITLNRPAKLNVLSIATLKALAAHFKDAQDDPETHCVILTGAGKAFCAGADLSEYLQTGSQAYLDPERLDAWLTIEGFAKPIIAAVNGYALGGGLELALLCDIIIASEDARFGTPEINVASFPGDGGTQRLPRIVGRPFATQMILTGTIIDAATAESKGLVGEVTTAAKLEQRALEVAETVASKPVAIAVQAKRAIRQADETSLSEGLRLERQLVAEAFSDPDRREGLRAFAEKREPRFNTKRADNSRLSPRKR